jgi:hypothetical protein
MLIWIQISPLLRKMIAFNNLARIVALSVVLTSLGLANPTPSTDKAVDNSNLWPFLSASANHIFSSVNHVVECSEEDKNVEEPSLFENLGLYLRDDLEPEEPAALQARAEAEPPIFHLPNRKP